MNSLTRKIWTSAIVLGMMTPTVTLADDDVQMGWVSRRGNTYWVENGVVQGTVDDPKAVGAYTSSGVYAIRGREIFDPSTDAWYWLDANNNGAMATNKEVWMPYIYQGDVNSEGKWVRYNDSGRMIKGWYSTSSGTYYYDFQTGAMFKGWHEIDGSSYYFDETTGILREKETVVAPGLRQRDPRTNPYSGGYSNCTWTAWQLALEHTDIAMPDWGYSTNWYSNARADGYTVSTIPSPYCIAVYYGHVALVTSVSSDGQSVYIKEGGYLGRYNERWVSTWGTGTKSLVGYIYLH